MTATTFKPTDYKSDLKPVWCPGCGDFGVVGALYKAMAELQLVPWNTVMVSGIGCSSRLPGYVETYGLNGLHGRALPLATGIKLARPETTVIITGGDGDGLAIGGNHFLHASRRNLDMTYIMMDNEIYGLTKGQAAPTTPTGDKTKSTVYGNPEHAVDPCELAISFGASWVGRAFSGDIKTMVSLMKEAIAHKGFAFLNIISPCVTWRGDDQFKEIREKLQQLPDDYDPTRRLSSLAYTREKGVVTVGVLYKTYPTTYLEEIAKIEEKAKKGITEAPKMSDILAGFY
jgi:2-oxoglutarate/2-oxoacid ferredoxin oxidoreductase subunit beta